MATPSTGGYNPSDRNHILGKGQWHSAQVNRQVQTSVAQFINGMSVDRDAAARTHGVIVKPLTLPEFKLKLHTLFNVATKTTVQLYQITPAAHDALRGKVIPHLDTYYQYAAQIKGESRNGAFNKFVDETMGILSQYALPDSNAGSRAASPVMGQYDGSADSLPSATHKRDTLVQEYRDVAAAISRIETELGGSARLSATHIREREQELSHLMKRQTELEYDIKNAEKSLRRAGESVDDFEDYSRGHRLTRRRYGTERNADALEELRRDDRRVKYHSVAREVGELKDRIAGIKSKVAVKHSEISKRAVKTHEKRQALVYSHQSTTTNVNAVRAVSLNGLDAKHQLQNSHFNTLKSTRDIATTYVGVSLEAKSALEQVENRGVTPRVLAENIMATATGKHGMTTVDFDGLLEDLFANLEQHKRAALTHNQTATSVSDELRRLVATENKAYADALSGGGVNTAAEQQRLGNLEDRLDAKINELEVLESAIRDAASGHDEVDLTQLETQRRAVSQEILDVEAALEAGAPRAPELLTNATVSKAQLTQMRRRLMDTQSKYTQVMAAAQAIEHAIEVLLGDALYGNLAGRMRKLEGVLAARERNMALACEVEQQAKANRDRLIVQLKDAAERLTDKLAGKGLTANQQEDALADGQSRYAGIVNTVVDVWDSGQGKMVHRTVEDLAKLGDIDIAADRTAVKRAVATEQDTLRRVKDLIRELNKGGRVNGDVGFDDHIEHEDGIGKGELLREQNAGFLELLHDLKAAFEGGAVPADLPNQLDAFETKISAGELEAKFGSDGTAGHVGDNRAHNGVIPASDAAIFKGKLLQMEQDVRGELDGATALENDLEAAMEELRKNHVASVAAQEQLELDVARFQREALIARIRVDQAAVEDVSANETVVWREHEALAARKNAVIEKEQRDCNPFKRTNLGTREQRLKGNLDQVTVEKRTAEYQPLIAGIDAKASTMGIPEATWQAKPKYKLFEQHEAAAKTFYARASSALEQIARLAQQATEQETAAAQLLQGYGDNNAVCARYHEQILASVIQQEAQLEKELKLLQGDVEINPTLIVEAVKHANENLAIIEQAISDNQKIKNGETVLELGQQEPRINYPDSQAQVSALSADVLDTLQRLKATYKGMAEQLDILADTITATETQRDSAIQALKDLELELELEDYSGLRNRIGRLGTDLSSPQNVTPLKLYQTDFENPDTYAAHAAAHETRKAEEYAPAYQEYKSRLEGAPAEDEQESPISYKFRDLYANFERALAYYEMAIHDEGVAATGRKLENQALFEPSTLPAGPKPWPDNQAGEVAADAAVHFKAKRDAAADAYGALETKEFNNAVTHHNDLADARRTEKEKFVQAAAQLHGSMPEDKPEDAAVVARYREQYEQFSADRAILQHKLSTLHEEGGELGAAGDKIVDTHDSKYVPAQHEATTYQNACIVRKVRVEDAATAVKLALDKLEKEDRKGKLERLKRRNAGLDLEKGTEGDNLTRASEALNAAKALDKVNRAAFDELKAWHTDNNTLYESALQANTGAKRLDIVATQKVKATTLRQKLKNIREQDAETLSEGNMALRGEYECLKGEIDNIERQFERADDLFQKAHLAIEGDGADNPGHDALLGQALDAWKDALVGLAKNIKTMEAALDKIDALAKPITFKAKWEGDLWPDDANQVAALFTTAQRTLDEGGDLGEGFDAELAEIEAALGLKSTALEALKAYREEVEENHAAAAEQVDAYETAFATATTVTTGNKAKALAQQAKVADEFAALDEQSHIARVQLNKMEELVEADQIQLLRIYNQRLADGIRAKNHAQITATQAADLVESKKTELDRQLVAAQFGVSEQTGTFKQNAELDALITTADKNNAAIEYVKADTTHQNIGTDFAPLMGELDARRSTLKAAVNGYKSARDVLLPPTSLPVTGEADAPAAAVEPTAEELAAWQKELQDYAIALVTYQEALADFNDTMKLAGDTHGAAAGNIDGLASAREAFQAQLDAPAGAQASPMVRAGSETSLVPAETKIAEALQHRYATLQTSAAALRQAGTLPARGTVDAVFGPLKALLEEELSLLPDAAKLDFTFTSYQAHVVAQEARLNAISGELASLAEKWALIETSATAVETQKTAIRTRHTETIAAQAAYAVKHSPVDETPVTNLDGVLKPGDTDIDLAEIKVERAKITHVVGEIDAFDTALAELERKIGEVDVATLQAEYDALVAQRDTIIAHKPAHMSLTEKEEWMGAIDTFNTALAAYESKRQDALDGKADLIAKKELLTKQVEALVKIDAAYGALGTTNTTAETSLSEVEEELARLGGLKDALSAVELQFQALNANMNTLGDIIEDSKNQAGSEFHGLIRALETSVGRFHQSVAKLHESNQADTERLAHLRYGIRESNLERLKRHQKAVETLQKEIDTIKGLHAKLKSILKAPAGKWTEIKDKLELIEGSIKSLTTFKETLSAMVTGLEEKQRVAKAAARDVAAVDSEAAFAEATKEGSNYHKTLTAGSPEAISELETELLKSRAITTDPELLRTAQVEAAQLAGETSDIMATLNGLEKTEKLKHLMRATRIHMVVEAVLRMERYELYAMLENPADPQNPVLNAEVQEKGLAAVLQLHAGEVDPSIAGSVHHARIGKSIGEIVAAYMVQQYGEVAVRNLIKDGKVLDLPEDEVAEINERLFGIVIMKEEEPVVADTEVAADAADAEEIPVKPPARPAVISEIYDRNTAEIRMKNALEKLGHKGAPKQVAMALKERNAYLQRAKDIILDDAAVHNPQRVYLELMEECDNAYKNNNFSKFVQSEFGKAFSSLFSQIQSGDLAQAEKTLKEIASHIDEIDHEGDGVLEQPRPDHGAMGLTTKSYHTMLNMLVQYLSNVLAIKGANNVLPQQEDLDIRTPYQHEAYQMEHFHKTKPLNAHVKMESRTEVEALTPTYYSIGPPPQLTGGISDYLDNTLTYVRQILDTKRVERRGFAVQALHNSLKALAGQSMRGVSPAKVVAIVQALMKLSALDHQQYGASPTDVRQLQLSLLCAHLAMAKGSGKAMTSLEKATLTNLLHQTGYLPMDSKTLHAIESDFREINEVKPTAAHLSQEQIDNFHLLTVLPALFHGHLFRSNDQLLQWSELEADSVLDSPNIRVVGVGDADYKEGVIHQFAEKSHLQAFEIQIGDMKHPVFVEVLEVDRAAVYKGEPYRGRKTEIQFARPTDISLSGESTYSQFMPSPVDYLQKAHLIHAGTSDYYLQFQQISAGPNAFSQLIEWCSDARNYNAIQQYTNIREAVLSKLLDAIHNMPEASITERHINDIAYVINTQFPAKVSGSLLKGFQMAFFGKQLLEAIKTKVHGTGHEATIQKALCDFEQLLTDMWGDLQRLLEDTGERNSRAKVMLAAMRQSWRCVSSEPISPDTMHVLFNARKAMRESRDRAIEEWRTDLADQELSGLSKESLHLVATAEALYAKREVELAGATTQLLDSLDALRQMLGIVARADVPIPDNAADWQKDGNLVFHTDRVYININRGLILFDGRTLDGVDERVFEHPLFKQAFGHEPIELEVMQLVRGEPAVNEMRHFYKPRKDEFADFRIHFDGANNMRITRECDLKLDTEDGQVVTLDLVDARRYQGNIPKGLIAGCQCWEIKTEGHPHKGSVVVLNREEDGEPAIGVLVPTADDRWVYKRVVNDTVEATYHKPEFDRPQGLMAALSQFSSLNVVDGTMELWSNSPTVRRIKMAKAGFEISEQGGRVTCGDYTVLRAGGINGIGAATGTLLMQKTDPDTGIVQLAALVPGVPLGSKALLFEVEDLQGTGLCLKPKNRLQRLAQAYHLARAKDYEKSLEAMMDGWNESPLSADEAAVMQACVDLAFCQQTATGENKNLLKWGTFVAAKLMNHMVLNNHMMKSSGTDPEADFMCINMKTLSLVTQLYNAQIGKGARLTDAILDKKFHYHQFDMAFRGLIRHLGKYGNGEWATTLKSSLAAGAGADAGKIEGYIDRMVAKDRVLTPVEVACMKSLLQHYDIETDVYHGEYERDQELSRQQLMMATMADTYSAAPVASLPLEMGGTPISRANTTKLPQLVEELKKQCQRNNAEQAIIDAEIEAVAATMHSWAHRMEDGTPIRMTADDVCFAILQNKPIGGKSIHAAEYKVLRNLVLRRMMIATDRQHRENTIKMMEKVIGQGTSPSEGDISALNTALTLERGYNLGILLDNYEFNHARHMMLTLLFTEYLNGYRAYAFQAKKYMKLIPDPSGKYAHGASVDATQLATGQGKTDFFFFTLALAVTGTVVESGKRALSILRAPNPLLQVLLAEVRTKFQKDGRPFNVTTWHFDQNKKYDQEYLESLYNHLCDVRDSGTVLMENPTAEKSLYNAFAILSKASNSKKILQCKVLIYKIVKLLNVHGFAAEDEKHMVCDPMKTDLNTTMGSQVSINPLQIKGYMDFYQNFHAFLKGHHKKYEIQLMGVRELGLRAKDAAKYMTAERDYAMEMLMLHQANIRAVLGAEANLEDLVTYMLQRQKLEEAPGFSPDDMRALKHNKEARKRLEALVTKLHSDTRTKELAEHIAIAKGAGFVHMSESVRKYVGRDYGIPLNIGRPDTPTGVFYESLEKPSSGKPKMKEVAVALTTNAIAERGIEHVKQVKILLEYVANIGDAEGPDMAKYPATRWLYEQFLKILKDETDVPKATRKFLARPDMFETVQTVFNSTASLQDMLLLAELSLVSGLKQFEYTYTASTREKVLQRKGRVVGFTATLGSRYAWGSDISIDDDPEIDISKRLDDVRAENQKVQVLDDTHVNLDSVINRLVALGHSQEALVRHKDSIAYVIQMVELAKTGNPPIQTVVDGAGKWEIPTEAVVDIFLMLDETIDGVAFFRQRPGEASGLKVVKFKDKTKGVVAVEEYTSQGGELERLRIVIAQEHSTGTDFGKQQFAGKSIGMAKKPKDVLYTTSETISTGKAKQIAGRERKEHGQFRCMDRQTYEAGQRWVGVVGKDDFIHLPGFWGAEDGIPIQQTYDNRITIEESRLIWFRLYSPESLDSVSSDGEKTQKDIAEALYAQHKVFIDAVATHIRAEKGEPTGRHFARLESENEFVSLQRDLINNLMPQLNSIIRHLAKEIRMELMEEVAKLAAEPDDARDEKKLKELQQDVANLDKYFVEMAESSRDLFAKYLVISGTQSKADFIKAARKLAFDKLAASELAAYEGLVGDAKVAIEETLRVFKEKVIAAHVSDAEASLEGEAQEQNEVAIEVEAQAEATAEAQAQAEAEASAQAQAEAEAQASSSSSPGGKEPPNIGNLQAREDCGFDQGTLDELFRTGNMPVYVDTIFYEGELLEAPGLLQAQPLPIPNPDNPVARKRYLRRIQKQMEDINATFEFKHAVMKEDGEGVDKEIDNGVSLSRQLLQLGKTGLMGGPDILPDAHFVLVTKRGFRDHFLLMTDAEAKSIMAAVHGGKVLPENCRLLQFRQPSNEFEMQDRQYGFPFDVFSNAVYETTDNLSGLTRAALFCGMASPELLEADANWMKMVDQSHAAYVANKKALATAQGFRIRVGNSKTTYSMLSGDYYGAYDMLIKYACDLEPKQATTIATSKYKGTLTFQVNNPAKENVKIFESKEYYLHLDKKMKESIKRVLKEAGAEFLSGRGQSGSRTPDGLGEVSEQDVYDPFVLSLEQFFAANNIPLYLPDKDHTRYPQTPDEVAAHKKRVANKLYDLVMAPDGDKKCTGAIIDLLTGIFLKGFEGIQTSTRLPRYASIFDAELSEKEKEYEKGKPHSLYLNYNIESGASRKKSAAIILTRNRLLRTYKHMMSLWKARGYTEEWLAGKTGTQYNCPMYIYLRDQIAKMKGRNTRENRNACGSEADTKPLPATVGFADATKYSPTKQAANGLLPVIVKVPKTKQQVVVSLIRYQPSGTAQDSHHRHHYHAGQAVRQREATKQVPSALLSTPHKPRRASLRSRTLAAEQEENQAQARVELLARAVELTLRSATEAGSRPTSAESSFGSPGVSDEERPKTPPKEPFKLNRRKSLRAPESKVGSPNRRQAKTVGDQPKTKRRSTKKRVTSSATGTAGSSLVGTALPPLSGTRPTAAAPILRSGARPTALSAMARAKQSASVTPTTKKLEQIVLRQGALDLVRMGIDERKFQSTMFGLTDDQIESKSTGSLTTSERPFLHDLRTKYVAQINKAGSDINDLISELEKECQDSKFQSFSRKTRHLANIVYSLLLAKKAKSPGQLRTPHQVGTQKAAEAARKGNERRSVPSAASSTRTTTVVRLPQQEGQDPLYTALKQWAERLSKTGIRIDREDKAKAERIRLIIIDLSKESKPRISIPPNIETGVSYARASVTNVRNFIQALNISLAKGTRGNFVNALVKKLNESNPPVFLP